MKEHITAVLVSAMRNSIPKEENLANVLMNILHIGKESIYRRLRGEVPFTFEEVVKISRKLKISLDDIVDTEKEHTVFSLYLVPPVDLMDNYYNALESNILLFEVMSADPDSKLRLAFNTLPYGVYLPYSNISKFRLFRWTYQFLEKGNLMKLAEFEVPSKIKEAEMRFSKNYYTISKTQLIFDNNAFETFITDINYFYKLNLISEEELDQLKAELLELLNDWELIAKRGYLGENKEIAIYISNINFEACYIHLQSKKFEISRIGIYAIDTLSSQNTLISNSQKRWIDSLKRCSTLISRSGEIERIEFFNRQRHLVNNILKY